MICILSLAGKSMKQVGLRVNKMGVNMSIIEKICEILRDFFDDESIVIDEKSAAKDVEGWDSLANVQIMLSIEEEFGVTFDLDDMVKFKCIGDIIACIERKTK